MPRRNSGNFARLGFERAGGRQRSGLEGGLEAIGESLSTLTSAVMLTLYGVEVELNQEYIYSFSDALAALPAPLQWVRHRYFDQYEVSNSDCTHSYPCLISRTLVACTSGVVLSVVPAIHVSSCPRSFFIFVVFAVAPASFHVSSNVIRASPAYVVKR